MMLERSSWRHTWSDGHDNVIALATLALAKHFLYNEKVDVNIKYKHISSMIYNKIEHGRNDIVIVYLSSMMLALCMTILIKLLMLHKYPHMTLLYGK